MVPMGFEFGFRKKLHVVKTRPEDWEETAIDLTQFIKKVNEIKGKYKIFQEEALTQISNYDQNILIVWKASTHTWEESLIILNKDIYNKQHFYVDDPYKFVQSRSPFMDISPEYPLEYISTPFSYDLRPGQGIVLMTTRR
jgi:starch synthase (maltosyl-transferring)